VLGAAARAPALGEGAIPTVGGKVVIVCLLVLCTEGIVELVAMSRRRPIRRVRPAPPQPVGEEPVPLARTSAGG
jgi:hypothetical protein